MEPSLDRRVISAIGPHPAVRSIRLAGSRAEGRANAFSDWDFVAAADDFPALAADHQCWMLMLGGPTKIDVIFPWRVPRELETAVADAVASPV